MSDEFNRTSINHEQEVVSRKQAEFQEAPGEAEAETVRDAFLKGAGSNPAGQAAALSSADTATRARAISRLQQEQGNAYVQRVVAESRGAPGRLVGLSQPEMVSEVLQRKGSGSPLPEGTRQNMEGFFGADLGNVRVHTDGEASTLNKELNAQAFTVGSDVFFSEGKYNPSSTDGQGLLAHELTHVGQQTGFGGKGVQRAAEEEEKKPPAAPTAAAPAAHHEEEAASGA